MGVPDWSKALCDFVHPQTGKWEDGPGGMTEGIGAKTRTSRPAGEQLGWYNRFGQEKSAMTEEIQTEPPRPS